ncbi:uncharacterized protein F5891DRAFT_986896 [Suillus fuscotomentosus]|uniref:Uncharacterized protein n=1 Tax=Suillus fuscotomentosus TaxID=1912939 RepID=A0AAD4DRB4_9AGAM|nr:uncharacterized protein F5891DRAFT_986896 [Suillus fuscotomentosus]KAG1890646.1 hypothetical protein F5891DRAFT_986896 [Suillus fuscotomentosus]
MFNIVSLNHQADRYQVRINFAWICLNQSHADPSCCPLFVGRSECVEPPLSLSHADPTHCPPLAGRVTGHRTSAVNCSYTYQLILDNYAKFMRGTRMGSSEKVLMSEMIDSTFNKPSQVAGALYDKFDHPIIRQGTTTVGSLTKKLGSLPASAHMLYSGSHFPNAGKFCWDKATGFRSNIQGCTDKFFQHAREFCPSDKMAELRESVDSIASTATTLYQVVKEAAEQCGIPLYTISNNLVNTFSVLFEELKEQFPPPGEASGHEKHMTMMNTSGKRQVPYFTLLSLFHIQ